MRTLTEKYNGVLRGIFSKDQFLRDARMEQSNLITQHNSYNDAVNILLNKGLISEYGGSDGDYEESKSTGGEAEKHYDLGLQAFLDGNELKASEHYQEALRLGSLLGWTEIDLPPYNTLNTDNMYEAEAPVTESAGAERFLDNLFKIANEELKAGRITHDEYEYVLKQIDTKEYDLLELGHDPSQALDKLIMQAQAELGPVGEGMTPEEWADAEEAERLAKHPEKKKIEDIKAMMAKEKEAQMVGKEESLEEGPAKNNPKIEKLVAGINDLIAQAIDSDGDPIGVVDPTSTWEEPYVYEPIQYKNGQLKIVSKSPYQKTSDVDIILSRDMEFDGIPTLRLIMRMYKKAIKQAGRMSNQDPEIDEKKLTAAEKAGKEKIVKGLKKSGMSAKDPSTYAIATSMAKELYEEGDKVKLKVGDVIDHKGKKKKVVRIVNNKISLEPVGSTGGEIEIDRQLGVRDSLKESATGTFNNYTDAAVDAKMLSRTEEGEVYVFEKEKVVQEFIVTKEPIQGAELAGVFVNGKLVTDSTSAVNEAKDEYVKIESPKPELPLDVLHHGIRFELDKKGIGNTPTEEEYMKAYKAACKNLEKDLLHYKKEEGAVEAPSSKSDEMVKVKLKESFKKIIRNILSENASEKKAFDLNGKPL